MLIGVGPSTAISANGQWLYLQSSSLALQLPSTTDISSARSEGWGLGCLTPLFARILLHLSYLGNHSCYELMCTKAMSCPDINIS